MRRAAFTRSKSPGDKRRSGDDRRSAGFPASPRDGGGFWSSTRYPGFGEFNVQPWADGGVGQAGYLTEGDDLVMKVWQNGTLVATTVATALGWVLIASAGGFGPILAATVLASAAYAPVLPLTDTYALKGLGMLPRPVASAIKRRLAP